MGAFQASIRGKKGAVTERAGAVFIFTRKDTAWSQRQLIKPPQPAVGGAFGWNVALDERTLAVGAPYQGPRDGATGSVYLFE